jgi:hypothetical protein
MRDVFSVAIIAAIALGAGASTPHQVQAQTTTYHFTDHNNNQDWNDSGNWWSDCSETMAGAVPSASENAEICANKTAEITDSAAVARTVTVRLGGKIRVLPTTSNASLTLGSGTADLTSGLSGPIELNTNNAAHVATLAFVSANHTLAVGPTGGSFVRGFRDDAVIDIQTSGKALTIDTSTSIRGRLVISGAGDFTNQGFVSANANGGTLTVAVGGTVSDTSTGDGNRWRVSATNGTLVFNATATGLVGNFLVESAGVLEIDHTVTTTGRLNQSQGTVQVNGSFTLGGASHHANLTGGSIIVAATEHFVHF